MFTKLNTRQINDYLTSDDIYIIYTVNSPFCRGEYIHYRAIWPQSKQHVRPGGRRSQPRWTKQPAPVDEAVGPGGRSSRPRWANRSAPVVEAVGPGGRSGRPRWTKQSAPVDESVGPGGRSSRPRWLNQSAPVDESTGRLGGTKGSARTSRCLGFPRNSKDQLETVDVCLGSASTRIFHQCDPDGIWVEG